MKYERTVTIKHSEHEFFVRTRLQLAITLGTAEGVHVSFRQPTDARFEAPIAFGVQLAAKRISLAGNRRGIEVTVFFVEYEHLGPKPAVVAMLAAQCACEALGVPEEARPHLDEAQCSVVLPLVVAEA